VWILTLLLFGCSTAEELPPEELPPHVSVGACDVQTDTLGSYYPIYTGPHVWWGARELGYMEVISDATAWNAFQQDLSLNLQPPAFPSEVALAVWEARDRCELEYADVEVYDLGDRYHAEVALDDYEGGCLEPCTNPGGVLVVLAVPARTMAPSSCRVTWDACYSE
jgi:hypothetical protein